jgi:LPS export ABC transporter protein LptC
MLAAMAIALIALVSVYALYRRGIDAGADLIKNIPKGSSLTIENLRHTAAREGSTEWTLEAAEAKMAGNRKSATLTDVSVVYFADDGDKVHLTADTGHLNLKSDDLKVSGNVVIWQRNYRIVTENLEYQNRRQLLVATTPVKVTGTTMSVTADSATFDLEKKHLRFEGNVYGTINRKLQM